MDKTTAALMAEIEALKKRITELEARPPFVINNHPPQQPQQYPGMPYTAPYMPTPWHPGPGQVWCGETAAAAVPFPLWNGPRNLDGSCAPLGHMTMTTGA